MQREANLADLETVFVRQLARLRYDVKQAMTCKFNRDREALVTFVVLNLLNSWSNFVRSYYFSCAFGTRTKSAIKVFPVNQFPDYNSAIGFAIRAFTPYSLPNTAGIWHRRNEPPWHDLNTLLRLATSLNFQNLAKIQSAMSLNVRVFIHLPTVRNFYAHRNQGTSDAARKIAVQYGIPSNYLTTRFLFSNPIRRPQPLIFEWIDELQISADYLTVIEDEVTSRFLCVIHACRSGDTNSPARTNLHSTDPSPDTETSASASSARRRGRRTRRIVDSTRRNDFFQRSACDDSPESPPHCNLRS